MTLSEITVSFEELLSSPAILALANAMAKDRREIDYLTEQLKARQIAPPEAVVESPAPAEFAESVGAVGDDLEAKPEKLARRGRKPKVEKARNGFHMGNAVLDALQGGGEMSGREIAARIAHCTDRAMDDKFVACVQVALSTAFKNGLIERVSRGVYRLPKKSRRKRSIVAEALAAGEDSPVSPDAKDKSSDHADVETVKRAIRDGATFRVDICEKTGLVHATVDDILKNSGHFVRTDAGWGEK